MGRTLNTYRNLIEQEINVFTRHFRSAPLVVQESLQIIFTRAQWYADATGYWKNGLYREKMLFSILFSQYQVIVNKNDFDEKKAHNPNKVITEN